MKVELDLIILIVLGVICLVLAFLAITINKTDDKDRKK